MSPKTMKLLAKPMLFATAIIWGTSFFIMKNALDIIPVFRLLAVRFTVGGSCWRPYAADDGKNLPRTICGGGPLWAGCCSSPIPSRRLACP